jgi:hypothetical protein
MFKILVEMYYAVRKTKVFSRIVSMIIFAFLPSFLFLLTVRGQSFFVKTSVVSVAVSTQYVLFRVLSLLSHHHPFSILQECRQLIESTDSQYQTIMLLLYLFTMMKRLSLLYNWRIRSEYFLYFYLKVKFMTPFQVDKKSCEIEIVTTMRL